MNKYIIVLAAQMLLSILVTPAASAQGEGAPVISTGQLITRPLWLSTDVTTILIFSAPICEGCIDKGNPDIATSAVSGVSNVLRVKASSDKLTPSNLTVFTTDGKIYSFSVGYAADPASTIIDFTAEQTESKALFEPGKLNEAQLQQTCEMVTAMPALRIRPKAKSIGMMSMRVSNIYQKQGSLFFKLTLTNKSAIGYDVNFMRCYQRDRKQRKRTSSMEKQVEPSHIYYADGPMVRPGGTNTIVIALDKFTIADNKFFCVEFFEKNGDRVLLLKIRGYHLLQARRI